MDEHTDHPVLAAFKDMTKKAKAAARVVAG
jgi:hypothetical protein